MPDGRQFHFPPGKYNTRQAAIIEQFAPRFVPGAVVLSLGGSNDVELAAAQPVMEKLGIPPERQGSLSKIVLWDQNRNWLFLFEDASDQGPVSPKRASELDTMLENCTAERIFVSVFSDMLEFSEHVDNIAWKTHAWLVDAPDHMIHLE